MPKFRKDKSAPIPAAEIWSAFRGLGMGAMSEGELLDLIAAHGKSKDFAARVIREAAWQALAILRARVCA